jgi:hypothetical protein
MSLEQTPVVSIISFESTDLPFKNKKYEKVKKNIVVQDCIQEEKSKYPNKKYCCVTGLESNYKDPKTDLFFHNYQIYSKIRNISENTVKEYKSVQHK